MLMPKRFQTERNIRALKCEGLKEPTRSKIRVGRKGVQVKGGRKGSGKEEREEVRRGEAEVELDVRDLEFRREGKGIKLKSTRETAR